jgi:membrane fusion protein (multidrug efflux system)
LITIQQVVLVEEDKTNSPERSKISNRGNRWKLLVIVFVAASILGAGYWWFFKRDRVSTDNAYVQADSARISARIPGTILQILVENDQPVAKEQVLVKLDPCDYQVAMDQSQAVLSRIESDIKASEVTISQTDKQTMAQVVASEAMVQEAKEKERSAQHKIEESNKERIAVQATLDETKRDFKRFENLYQSRSVSEQQWERARTNLEQAGAELKARDAEIAALKATLDAIRQEVSRAQAQLKVAQSRRDQVEIERHKLAALRARKEEAAAELQAAKLNLSYCIITAPISGYIAQKGIQVGERIQTGQPLMAVVPLQDVYIEANFKETQLKNVRLGQPVSLWADIYPAHTYHGTVIGIRAGTGAAFSLFPPENATGNWIKVVQRIPVKIRLNIPPPPEYPLRLGNSLNVTIYTKDKSGGMLILPSSSS